MMSLSHKPPQPPSIMNSSSAYYHRPYQSSGGTSGKALKSSSGKEQQPGRALLDLLRSRDKILIGKKSKNNNETSAAKQNDDDEEEGKEVMQLEHEIIAHIDYLNASIRRCGLFANSEKAQSFYTHASDRSSSVSTDTNADEHAGEGSSGGGSKKRKRKKGGAGGGGGGGGSTNNSGSLSATSYGIYLESHNSSNNTPSSFSGLSAGGDKLDLDEGLVITAICRILGVTVGRKKKSDKSDDSNLRSGGGTYSYGLMYAALNVLSSLCDHAKDGMVQSLAGDDVTCAIEGDMIGSIGSPLLDALADNILYLYHRNDKDEMSLEGLAGCFKTCVSVVSLLETRLSRADKTIQSLRNAAWLVLNNLPGLEGGQEKTLEVQKAATALLSACVLAGNSDGTPPSKIWSQSMNEGITLLRWAISDFFPMPSIDGSNGKTNDGKGDSATKANIKQYHEDWLAIAKEAASAENEELDLGSDLTDTHRYQALRSRVQCLVSYILSLLKMEHYPLHSSNSMSSSTLQLPIDSLLDISEILLSFPLAAEAKYRSTKPRLRSSPIKDGLISPNGAMEIAPDLRLCGHALLDVTIQSCRGGSGVLGRARRIVGMSVANLQSSCSLPLLSVVVDSGRRSSSGGSSIGSWLRGSIPLRIKSIHTFHSVAISLGSGVLSSNGTAKSVCRALVLVGGCLLEQVNRGDGEVVDEWGTLGERARLVEISSTALGTCIAAFGGLIPNNVRGTLDSITHTCLSALYSRGASFIFAFSHVKQSMLQLGMNCLCVPWGDGGRCNTGVTNIVRTVSTMLGNDPDLSVASAALSTLATSDAFMTPRAPPILIPTRDSLGDSKADSHNSGLSASAVLKGMHEAKVEMISSKEAAAKKSDKKSKKKSKKEKKNDEDAKTPPEVADDTANVKDSSDLMVDENIGKAPGNFGKSDTKAEPNPKEGNFSAACETDAITPNKEMQHSTSKPSGDIEAKPQNYEDGLQDAPGDKPGDEIDAPPGVAVEDTEMKEDSDNDDDEEEGDGDSLDDFPDIIDEDPDEEDRV